MSGPEPDNPPAITTTLKTNVPSPGCVTIVLPGEGDLWVSFSCADIGPTPPRAWVWRNASLFLELKLNESAVVATRKNDWLVYELGESDQKITLVWGYVE